MASVIHHFTRQLKDTGKIRMFEGSGGYGNGEQRRDFVLCGTWRRSTCFLHSAMRARPL
jgi:ADP-L-glycero-D-manno-heptose 6-epimerase